MRSIRTALVVAGSVVAAASALTVCSAGQAAASDVPAVSAVRYVQYGAQDEVPWTGPGPATPVPGVSGDTEVPWT
ncbi:hypothetical protein ACIRRH_24515 [Kitasatospora sp. NPDC101235]|uniref:hypothetical protein n=1 Tax=Kitasatospora sp. NPDC101235 TaxID=3364101 RepID=UPI003801C676